jgi:hypothetical protein
VPIPYGLKSPSDSFYRADGGTLPSQIRIYAAPTTTASVGIAICVGPMQAGANLPRPVADLGGNCIVTAVPAASFECEDDTDMRPDGSDSLSQDRADIASMGTCTSQSIQAYHASADPKPTVSPFQRASPSDYDTRDELGDYMTDLVPDT